LKIDKLLAGILGLALISGLVSPAFADPEMFTDPSGPLTPEQISNIQSAHNIVFDNGGEPAVAGFGYAILPNPIFQITLAEDFVIDSDTFVTDFHFVSSNEPTIIQYAIYSDKEGFPDTELVFGTSQDLGTNFIAGATYEVWFDLEDPFFAKAGEKHWFSIHSPVQESLFWRSCTGGFGEEPKISETIPIVAWDDNNADCLRFLLSGHLAPDEPVGGEFLPIDSTALVLAGLQTSAIWMLPVLAGIAGSAFGILYIKSRRN